MLLAGTHALPATILPGGQRELINVELASTVGGGATLGLLCATVCLICTAAAVAILSMALNAVGVTAVVTISSILAPLTIKPPMAILAAVGSLVQRRRMSAFSDTATKV